MTDDKVKVDRHLYLTEDGCRVVEEGDVRGRWLHWAPGNEVPKDEYYSLVEREAEAQEVEFMDPPRRKPGRPPASKTRVPRENK